MNKRRSALICVIILFVLIGALIVYIFSELFNESEIPEVKEQNKNALKFKEDYESLNGETLGENKIRELSIPEDNPFIYKSAEDIVDMINNSETFIVYFGFNKCPWCRSVLPTMIESAKKKGIDKIYYVDVLDIRDTYELDDNHKAVKTKDGSEGYNKLIDLLSSVLDDYAPLTYTKGKKTIKVNINEKRIYAPNFVIVKNGKPIALETGISERQKNAYEEITDAMTCEMREKFNCFFDKFNSDNGTCSLEEQIC